MKIVVVESRKNEFINGQDFRFIILGRWKIYKSLSGLELMLKEIPWWMTILGWLAN